MISHDDSPSCQTCTHYRDQALRARTLRDVHRAGGVEASCIAIDLGYLEPCRLGREPGDCGRCRTAPAGHTAGAEIHETKGL